MGRAEPAIAGSYDAFKAVVDLVAQEVQSGSGRIRVFWNGTVNVELSQPPDSIGMNQALFAVVARDVLNLLAAIVQGRGAETLTNASRDGQEAYELTERKLQSLETSGLVERVRPSWRFLVSSQSVVFDGLHAYLRTTPQKPGSGPDIVSAQVRLRFRDNLTGQEAQVVTFEADGFTLDSMIKGLTDLRDGLREHEGRVSDGQDQARSEKAAN